MILMFLVFSLKKKLVAVAKNDVMSGGGKQKLYSCGSCGKQCAGTHYTAP